jgi:hypothetical protein
MHAGIDDGKPNDHSVTAAVAESRWLSKRLATVDFGGSNPSRWKAAPMSAAAILPPTSRQSSTTAERQILVNAGFDPGTHASTDPATAWIPIKTVMYVVLAVLEPLE